MKESVFENPEIQKFLTVKRNSELISEFLRWLDTSNFVIAVKRRGRLEPAVTNREQMLAAFFDIDLDALDKELADVLQRRQNGNE